MKIMPSQEQIGQQLESLRTKILVGQGSEIHNSAVEWVRNIDYKYGTQEGEDVTRPSVVGKPYKAQVKRMDSFPPGLSKLKDFFLFDRQIPVNEIHAAIITVYPPPRESSSYENTIETALMVTRDRFIYVIGSDEMVEYTMQNPDQMSETFGMKVPKNAMREIPEHVERGYAYHMQQTSAVAMCWKFNDTNFFKKMTRNGKGFRETSFEKRVRGRYIVVIDFLMDAKRFKETIKETVGYISEIAEDEKGTAKGVMAQKALEKIKDEEEDVEDVEIPDNVPQLVDIKTDETFGTEPSTKTETVNALPEITRPQVTQHVETEYDDFFAGKKKRSHKIEDLQNQIVDTASNQDQPGLDEETV